MPSLTAEQVEEAARALPDHTLATSFLEPDARKRVIALILFANEIGRARAVVSEAGLAAIRLQWWRDTLDQIYAGKGMRAHPTAVAVAGTIQEANLPRGLFDAMIDGHMCELDAAPFATWIDLEAYLDATFGNLNRLSLLACGLSTLTTIRDEAARQAAITWGLAHMLRVLPVWSQRRSRWLPDEVCADLESEAMFGGAIDAALRAILGHVRQRLQSTRTATNLNLRTANLGSHFPVLAPACLAMRMSQAAIPKIGLTWRMPQEISLLERQIRMTISVARGRV